MRIAFYDRTPVDYVAETPFQRALGGSESALCYLSIGLARLGHEIFLITNTSSPGMCRGVQCSNHHDPGCMALLKSADVIVAANESLGRKLRDNDVDRPMVLWVQHAHDQPAIKGLESSRERKSWSAFAFVSDWQRQKFAEMFWVPEERSRVMRNAVSPAFADLSSSAPWFSCSDPPTLFYASTPYRGLDVLLDALPLIRAELPGTRLRVFSGFATTYGMKAEEDPYHALYDRARTVDGVDYIGSIAQPELAREAASAAALSYPSTFAETSCIAVLEAMAAGALVIATRLGALPETTHGFAELVEYSSDRGRLAKQFAVAAVKALKNERANPDAAHKRRADQIVHVRANHTWPVLALAWQSWLLDIVQTFGGVL